MLFIPQGCRIAPIVFYKRRGSSKMLRIKDFVNIKLYILATLAIPTLIAAVIVTAFWNRQAIVLTSGPNHRGGKNMDHV